MTSTQELIKKYAWDYRFHPTDEELPQKEFNKVNQAIRERFTKDFEWKGQIPYMTFSNLLSIREHLLKTDEDSMLGIVAPPGVGKSTFALATARLLDSKFNPKNVIFTNEHLNKFLGKATKELNRIKKAREKGLSPKNKYSGSVIVLDEGVYMLFSGDANSKAGKMAIKLFSIIRALNLIFIVNITNWRKISQGVKEDRFKVLIQLPQKGFIKFYSPKRIQNIQIKKNSLKWPSPNFYEQVGLISDCSFWREYESAKSQFLDEVTNEA